MAFPDFSGVFLSDDGGPTALSGHNASTALLAPTPPPALG